MMTENAPASSISTLTDHPGWHYLLKEFATLYRFGSSGGSKVIRGHRNRVRQALTRLVESNPEVRDRTPVTLPVVGHLPRAFDLGSRSALPGMSRALERVEARLTWEYGYEKVPQQLVRKYGYCEVVGPRGPVVSEGLILGFVLFAPETTYPQHSHAEIEESYVSVAGSWSENDLAVYAPGSLILNRPGQEHRITTGETDPCLLAYAWIGPGEKLAEPGMKFSRVRKRTADGE